MKKLYCMRILLYFMLATALTGCRTPPPPPRIDPEIENQVAAARNARAAGLTERAAAHFTLALNRARLIDDTPEIARNAYNLAACQADLGQWEEADNRLTEAQAAFSKILPTTPSELDLLQAKIKRATGRTDEAIEYSSAWLMSHPASANDKIRPAFQTMLAEMLCETDNCDEAQRILDQPVPAIDSMHIATRAAFYRLQARIATKNGKLTDAAAFFDQAAENYRGAGNYAAMADCLTDAARAYVATGNEHAAIDRFYRAARSLYQQGDMESTLKLIDNARPVAKKVGDDATLNLLEELARHIDKQAYPENPATDGE